MTYDVYAILPDCNVLVASGNDQKHVMDFADRMISKLRMKTLAVATLIREEHVIHGNNVSLEQYVKGN